MKRIFFSMIFLFVGVGNLFAADLTLKDIPKTMRKLFHYHIENKKLTPILLKRSFKIYIENFDRNRSYLLMQEVEGYLAYSDQDLNLSVYRYSSGDFSDFISLNQKIQKSILRSRAIREQIQAEIIEGNLAISFMLKTFPQDERELYAKQKQKMVQFLKYHMKKVPIDSKERRQKVLDLYEKKIQRFENSYLFVHPNGHAFDEAKIHHYLALRILKSLAKSLDAHTSVFSEEEATAMRMNLEMQYKGVGIILSEGIDGIYVSEIVKGSPADQENKIQVNDFIVSVNGKKVENASFDEIMQWMKDPKENKIYLQMMRLKNPTNSEENAIWEVVLEKKPFVVETDRLSYETQKVSGGVIGTITLKSFYENGNGVNSASDMKKALYEMRQQGKIQGVVLDLRENSGGFLSQAAKVAGLFITSGVVVISKYNEGETHYLRKMDTKAVYNGPLIVLTSKLSASASEIVAQALQDYGAALIVGDKRTFGKGSIQIQTVTNKNADIFFKVTVGRYYTVSGKSTQIKGVKADIVVPTLFSAFKIGERYLEYPISEDQITPAYKDHLSDLDMRTRQWFQYHYLPNLQKKIHTWKNMLPALKKKSARRLAKNIHFQIFLKRQQAIKDKIAGKEPNRIDMNINFGKKDLQMEEAIFILNDMIRLSKKSHRFSFKKVR